MTDTTADALLRELTDLWFDEGDGKRRYDEVFKAARAYLSRAQTPPRDTPPREPRTRCIRCRMGWATSQDDDVCDRCRNAAA